jgi:hypothetical protein
VWARNLLFLAGCLAAVVAVGASFLGGGGVDAVADYRAKENDQEFQEVVARVDREFQAHWAAAGLKTAKPAEPLAIARRLSLGLTGTAPSIEEIRAFESLPDSVGASERVQWWANRLLADRRYADYVAERFARSYVGIEEGPFILYRRRRFVTWLSDRLHEKDAGYDAIVRRLISDSGLWTDNPTVNFVTVTVDQNDSNQPDEIRLAARTTRAFLGLRIDCLQCHDNNLPREMRLGPEAEYHDGLQSDFHKLAAFYGQTTTSITGIKDGAGEYETKYLDAEKEEVVAPAVPYAPELWVQEGTRREQLARWVTEPGNKPFARAAVNRVWALLFGRPLCDPIDDIPLYGYDEGDERRWWTGESKFPPGLEALADDFASHGFDIPRLIRTIAATHVFQCDSRADFEVTDRHEREWAVFPLTRLRPEQVAGALIQSSSLKTIDAQTHIFSQLAKFAQQNEFVTRYGDKGEDEFQDRGGTIPQRLLLMNGKLMDERTAAGTMGNASARVAKLAPTNDTAVEVVYLAVLSRRPSAAEAGHFIARLSEADNGERAAAIEDLFWVLLNSTEFSWNH